MKKIKFINVPQVGTFDCVNFDVYSTGATPPEGENLNVDYNALFQEQKDKIDNFVQMMYGKLLA